MDGTNRAAPDTSDAARVSPHCTNSTDGEQPASGYRMMRRLQNDVREVIRTWSYAPQRVESFYTPLLDFLIVLPAIIKMLKMIAEDWRHRAAA